jgi:hypothetical protein
MSMLAGAILVPPSVPGGMWAVSLLGYAVMFGAALLWCKRPPWRRPRGIKRNGA